MIILFTPFNDLAMEAYNSIFLPLLPVSIICLILFLIGYWLGTLRAKKLMKQMAKMEKRIMDLNTELLYGPPAGRGQK